MFNMHTVYTRLYILYCYDPENLGSIASVERTEQKRLLRVAVFFSTRSSIWYRSERDDRVMAEGHDFKAITHFMYYLSDGEWVKRIKVVIFKH